MRLQKHGRPARASCAYRPPGQGPRGRAVGRARPGAEGRLEGRAPDIDPLVASPIATHPRSHRGSSFRPRLSPAGATTWSPVRPPPQASPSPPPPTGQGASNSAERREAGRCPGSETRDTLVCYLFGGRLPVGLCPLFFFRADDAAAGAVTGDCGARRRSRGLEVWDIQSRRETNGQWFGCSSTAPDRRATPEDSVSIEDCEQVNREMGTILDVEDPLPFRYTLGGVVARAGSSAERPWGLSAVCGTTGEGRGERAGG